ncbi:hypothetical protein PS718_00803 [Pseudomonas fluorescens]|uniref:RING-type E3 ubiquitin transferase n=1 Tax=Pseudomonas fluorescens TaxID=294 RepID=A0A5E7AFP0_PSEFL|nr:NEL-type E3 ubiquitin ligase domain-containing protein [Pseudomonas fluorescens]VVN76930.1 hypothetical protein PS718_00803 [Pseudomonas fluorescens]
MSDASTPDQNKGRHYDFISSTLHENFKTASLGRGKALASAALKIEPWYNTAPAGQHAQLKNANLKAWGSQNKVDKLFEKLQDVRTFAAPLLQAKLKEKYAVTHDVKTTFLHLYIPKTGPWYTIDTLGGVTTRTVSLLDAALHNFAASETVLADSQYISQPDKLGHFDILPIKAKMTISQFQTLCRELDIGKLYNQHLQSYLLPGEPVAVAVMQHKVTQSLKDALSAAAELALTTGDIQLDAYKLITALANGAPLPLLNGLRMQCCDLSMMETRLTGVLLLVPAARDSQGIRQLIAYVPHDPEHPLKAYTSPDAFMTELTRQLRENKTGAASQLSYRQFFSQFVDHQQRGHFFAELEQRLSHVVWHEKVDPTDSRPPWRPEDKLNAHLKFELLPLSSDYWTHAYQQKLNKILNDAKVIAVSTADTDTRARWAWWENFKKIVSDIFNVALLIATPFVPGLGELMMAYTVYQLTYDVIEGIVDLAEGLGLEAAEHVISVVTDVMQLALFATGTEIAGAFNFKLSPLIEGMKPVQLPDGKPALWHADLAPYEQNNLSLPDTSRPDPQGLHQLGRETVLPLDGKLYSVEKASADPASRTHRIKHPQRPNAYQPTLEHNGHGAWLHEAETPADWADERLMRRLGHRVERFSPAELEQIRITSGTENDALRRLHSDNSPPPPLLTDAINRLDARHDAQTASANIRAGLPIDPQSDWYESIATALPGWPPERALKVVYEQVEGYSRQYGNPAATPADTLVISQSDLNAGRLPERLSEFLDEAQLQNLLGRNVPAAERPQALRDVLADAVQAREGVVAKRLYQAGERSNSPEVRVIRRAFPDMPQPLADKLLTQARPAELQRIVDEQRLPLRLKAQARELDFEAASARAYDGFYHDDKMLPNTERLVLNTLKLHTDTFADLRIEVRDGSYDGPLRCSVGPQDASTVRRLLRTQDGDYEVLDADNRPLHDAADLYQSILNALPDDKRTQLAQRDGPQLKAWIMEQSAAPADRRVLLAEPPIRPVASVETETLVRGWPWPFGKKTLEQEVRQLYPKLNERQVSGFVEDLRSKPDPDAAVRQLKDELNELRNMLDLWREGQPVQIDPSGEPIHGVSADYLRNGGQFLQDRLLECFERKSEAFTERGHHPEQGYTLDLSTDIANPEHDRWWSQMRRQPGMKKYLDKITALKIDNRRFSTASSGLLGDLPQLRQLSARQCGLTKIPPDIGDMPHLQTLDLTDNNIRLNDDSVARLGALTRLETLRLTGNPLGQPPDIGRMHRLRELSLANSNLDQWPIGLFQVGNAPRPRPRGFALDMRRSPITTVPHVSPGSEEAFILSRARFDTERLTDAERTRYGDYRHSAGFTRQEAYNPAVQDEIRHWQSFPGDSKAFSPSYQFNQYREQSWQDVMNEPGSGDFFRVIRKQRDTHDYQSDASRRRLTQRVWEMIDAVSLDSELRTQLFEQAREPDSCQDGGAQLFNSMGLKVQVSKAYAESTSARTLDDNLVKLARSAARLERVGDIAREEISRQQQQYEISPTTHTPPDDVEVHMAFENGLADRLGLPWQSEGMVYDQRSGVDQSKIDTAYNTVIDREQGDGLVNGMIDLFVDDFWERHLRKTHPTQYETNDSEFEIKLGQLEDLRETQARWAAETEPANLSSLGRKLEGLAVALKADQAEVFSGDPMSDARYNRMLTDLAYARKELSRRLTREALTRVGP